MNALIISAILGVIMMFSSILLNDKRAIRGIAVTGMALLLGVNILEMCGTKLFHVNTAGMMAFDRFALLFNAIAMLSTLLYFILSAKDMERTGVNYAEYFALIFFITCGIILVSSFKSLLILFLGVEIISIPLYILTGADKRNLKSNEASLKYFLLGVFSTGLMLMGIAFLYGERGTFATEFVDMFQGKPSPLLVAGMTLLLFSMAFKVSAAPFHFWTPDVYDGAPTVFTSFMATIVKAAIFIAFIRLFDESFGPLQPQWKMLFGILTVATLFIGNITAVFQQSVKRMLAYSSIAQAGFMLMALFALNADAKEGLLVYAAAYCFATIGIFAVLARMNDHTFDGFNGLARKEPLVAAMVSIFLFSLAGIPLTGGFLGKLYMLKAVLATKGSMWLVIFAVLMAAVSVYYYFRIIQSMYFKQGEPVSLVFSTPFKATLVLLVVLLLLLGLAPDLLLTWYYF